MSADPSSACIESFSFTLLSNTENSAGDGELPSRWKLKLCCCSAHSEVIKLKLTLQYRWTNKTQQLTKERETNQKNLIMSVVEPCRERQ